jgi:hypothetical protein
MSDDVSDAEIAELGLEQLERCIVDVRGRANAAEERDDFDAEDRERALLRRLKEARAYLEESLEDEAESGTDGTQEATAVEVDDVSNDVSSVVSNVVSNAAVIVVASLEIEQGAEIEDIEPQELQENIRELRAHLRTILDVEERIAAGEQIGADAAVAVEVKSTVIYNLMRATQRLTQLGIEVEQETRLTPAELAARNAARSTSNAICGASSASSRPPRGRLQHARHELQRAAVASRDGMFGKAELSEGPLQKFLNVSFCLFLFIGCCIAPILLVYNSLSVVEISEDEDVDQLLYVIAELVFGFFCCTCFVFCSGCCVLGSGSQFNDQLAVTTARLGWCAWVINFALGVAAVVIPTILLTDHPDLLASAGTPLDITTAAGIAVIVSGVYVMLWNCCLNPTSMHAHAVRQAEEGDEGEGKKKHQQQQPVAIVEEGETKRSQGGEEDVEVVLNMV